MPDEQLRSSTPTVSCGVAGTRKDPARRHVGGRPSRRCGWSAGMSRHAVLQVWERGIRRDWRAPTHPDDGPKASTLQTAVLSWPTSWRVLASPGQIPYRLCGICPGRRPGRPTSPRTTS
eukprot:228143-Chlamydomonas_euryale.AAC.8